MYGYEEIDLKAEHSFRLQVFLAIVYPKLVHTAAGQNSVHPIER